MSGATMMSRAPIAADNHGVLYLNSHLRLDDISDGLAQTILLGESRDHELSAMSWASGTSVTLRNAGHPINDHASVGTVVQGTAGLSDDERLAAIQQMVEDGVVPINFVGGFSSLHPLGANFVFCDGSIHFLKVSINQQIYRNLAHRADGEAISDDAF